MVVEAGMAHNGSVNLPNPRRPNLLLRLYRKQPGADSVLHKKRHFRTLVHQLVFRLSLPVFLKETILKTRLIHGKGS